MTDPDIPLQAEGIQLIIDRCEEGMGEGRALRLEGVRSGGIRRAILAYSNHNEKHIE